MLEMLVIENNHDYAKEKINYVISKFSEIRLNNIATTYNEVLTILNNKHIDIILMCIKSINYEIKKIIELFYKDKMYQYTNSIIILSKQKIKIFNTYINTINKLEILSNKIENIIKVHNYKSSNIQSLNLKIHQELNYLNFNFSYKGTQYLSEVIYIIISRGKFEDFELKNDVYSILSKKYNKSYSNIKFNINYAIENMYYECNEKKLSQYLRYKVTHKPRTKDIICSIIKNLNKI